MKIAFVIILSLTSSIGLAQGNQPSDPPGATRGLEAIKKHNKNLDKIAEKAGITREKLEASLKNDNSLVLDGKDGSLYIVENAAPLTDKEIVINPITTDIPDSDTFKLHSKPGASRIIHLDMDGHALNYQGDFIDAKPLNVESGVDTITSKEMNMMKEIWLRVAEDYAAFDVDVTTEPINEADLNGPNGGIRVIITSTEEWAPWVGGMAYVGSFMWPDDTPVWVFSDNLTNKPKSIAEAVSHEAGHALGLMHSALYNSTGSVNSSYNYGPFSPQSLDEDWVPLMGAAYNRKHSVWHTGPDTGGINSIQDDVAILSKMIPLLPSDAPDSDSDTSFRKVQFTQTSSQHIYKHQGYIAQAGETDALRIYVGAGDLNLTVAPTQLGANANFSVKLKTSSGEVLASHNPDGAVAISLAKSGLSEGIYILEIKSEPYITESVVGSKIPVDAGSLGRYFITGHSAAYSQAIPNDTFVVEEQVPNVAPEANAGADQNLTYNQTVVTLKGSAVDSDGSIAKVSWVQVSGPNTASLQDQSTLTLTASNLISGSYIFRLTATDDKGLSASDDVKVVVAQAPVNKAPTVNAGSDISITLPTSSVSLNATASDSDGSIASISWSQISGPVNATISGGSSLSPSISNLSFAGSYTFRITVSDDKGAQVSDDVLVIVNPQPTTVKGKGGSGGKGGGKRK